MSLFIGGALSVMLKAQDKEQECLVQSLTQCKVFYDPHPDVWGAAALGEATIAPLCRALIHARDTAA